MLFAGLGGREVVREERSEEEKKRGQDAPVEDVSGRLKKKRM